MNQTPPYPLIAKYLANECNPQETNEFFEWLNATSENEKIFSELSAEWELVNRETKSEIIIPNQEKIWNKIQKHIHPFVISYPKSFVIKVASIAATIALVLGLSISFLLNDKVTEIPTLTSTFIAPQGQKSQLILADGTKVWLNSGTSLTYTNKFGQSDRKVELQGEAFFDVVKNADLKFIVNTGKVNVVVHGTAFNVKSYPTDADVSVSLVRGKVDVVEAESNHSLALMMPGEKVVVAKSNFKISKSNCDTNLEGLWRLDRLKFEGASIAEVSEKLEKWYGVNIEIINAQKFNKYWFTVKTESLLEILKSMNNLQPIHYDIQHDKVLISTR